MPRKPRTNTSHTVSEPASERASEHHLWDAAYDIERPWFGSSKRQEARQNFFPWLRDDDDDDLRRYPTLSNFSVPFKGVRSALQPISFQASFRVASKLEAVNERVDSRTRTRTTRNNHTHIHITGRRVRVVVVAAAVVVALPLPTILQNLQKVIQQATAGHTLCTPIGLPFFFVRPSVRPSVRPPVRPFFSVWPAVPLLHKCSQ